MSMVLGTAVFAEEVRVYNWSDYIDEELLTKFEEETGIKLIYDVFDSNEVLETKMLAGGSGYDVVVPTARLLCNGRSWPLVPSSPWIIPSCRTCGNIWDVIAGAHGNLRSGQCKHAINYMWGTTGIGVNVAKVTELLGEPMRRLARMSLVLRSGEHGESWLIAGCYFPGCADRGHSGGFDLSGRWIPTLRPTRTRSRRRNRCPACRAALCEEVPFVGIHQRRSPTARSAWPSAGRAMCLQARDRAAEANNGVEVAYNAPKEGALMWFDMMAIPADAPNPEAAHKFLDFILDAENMAAASNYVYLCQRQQGGTGIPGGRRDRGSGDLSRRRNRGEPLHQVALRPEGTAGCHAALD